MLTCLQFPPALGGQSLAAAVGALQARPATDALGHAANVDRTATPARTRLRNAAVGRRAARSWRCRLEAAAASFPRATASPLCSAKRKKLTLNISRASHDMARTPVHPVPVRLDT